MIVYSCSPMQWMLHSTAIPAIIIIMCCYKTVDLYWHLSSYLVSFCPKKMAKKIFIWLKKILIFSQIG